LLRYDEPIKSVKLSDKVAKKLLVIEAVELAASGDGALWQGLEDLCGVPTDGGGKYSFHGATQAYTPATVVPPGWPMMALMP
jgi:hypothetical protein